MRGTKSVYALMQLILGHPALVQITEQRFKEIKRARLLEVEGLGIEEKYDLVLGNYIEYERELLSISLDDMVFHKLDWSEYRTDAHAINRRIVNFVSATRLYSDQIGHHLSTLYGTLSSQYTTLIQDWKAIRSTSKPYQFVEALRNHIQHRALPVQLVTYSSKWEPAGTSERLRFAVSPAIDSTVLMEDSKFKKSLLDPPKTGDKLIRLSPIIRSCMEAIWKRHERARAVIRSDLTFADQIIEAAIAEGRAALGSDLGLAAVVLDEARRVTDSEHLDSQFIKHRRRLEQRNQSLGLFSRRFVSSWSGDEP
jgi:hypothetical protein